MLLGEIVRTITHSGTYNTDERIVNLKIFVDNGERINNDLCNIDRVEVRDGSYILYPDYPLSKVSKDTSIPMEKNRIIDVKTGRYNTYCPVCNTKININDKYCRSCGQKLK